jgi:hypothetical protein
MDDERKVALFVAAFIIILVSLEMLAVYNQSILDHESYRQCVQANQPDCVKIIQP